MFIVNCDNKGCYKSTAALIDPNDGEAYCAECDKKITNITSIAKNQLKLFKQVKKNNKIYSVKCEKCKDTNRPKIGPKDVLFCSKCNVKTTGITKQFEILVREAIIKDREDEQSNK